LGGVASKVCGIDLHVPGDLILLKWYTSLDMTRYQRPNDPKVLSHNVLVDDNMVTVFGLETPDVFDTYSGEPMTKQKANQRRRNFARYRNGRNFTADFFKARMQTN
jgi:hypothetical protein